MKYLKRIGFLLITLIVGCCLFVSVVFTAVELVAYDDGFYEAQYEANDASTLTGLSMDQLMQITDEMQKFLRGERNDFDIYATIDGEYCAVFTEREQEHMLDVQQLFLKFGMIRWISVGVMAVLFFILFVTKRQSAFRVFLIAAIGSVSALVVLTVVGALFFEPLFTAFHQVFFTNTFWSLDPSRSILINMVPQAFFTACAIRIAVYACLFFAVCIVFFAVCYKKIKGKSL